MPIADPSFNPSGNTNITDIKNAGLRLAEIIGECTPEGRRQRMALSFLEMSLMMAVKSATVGDD